MRRFADPEPARGGLHDDGVRRNQRVDGSAVPKGERLVSGPHPVAEPSNCVHRGGRMYDPAHDLVTTGTPGDRRRDLAHAEVLRIVRKWSFQVIRHGAPLPELPHERTRTGDSL